MKKREQEDVLGMATRGLHVQGRGRNFRPLVGAGSWEISGFHYGRSKCACCGRPISHVLHLKNASHSDAAKLDPAYPFPETIEIGIVCGPKVFTESCIGFYDDPSREWERQLRSWKDFISYTILCVKNADLWAMVPEGLRMAVDAFLKDGYERQEHSGGFWQVKDGKKRYLRTRQRVGQMPRPWERVSALGVLLAAAKRNALVSVTARLQCDPVDGTVTLTDPGQEAA